MPPEHDTTDRASLDSTSRFVHHPLHQSPLYIQKEVHYSKPKLLLYRVTSTLNTVLFLSVLMFFAIVKALFHAACRWFKPNPASPYPILSNTERKLVPRLAYYFEINNLRLLEYKVTTEDGFIIILQRVIDPNELWDTQQKRRPMLLLHGLLQSSGAYASSGRDSLAFYFFRQGYDVWLGNNRCGFEPQHVYLSPEDPNMWNWNIYNMAKFDLPAMVDYVLSKTPSQFPKVALVAHSQGTTQTFLALLSKNVASFNNQLNDKLSCFVALAPAVFGGELLRTKLFIRFMNMLPKLLFNYFFGVHAFMPIMMTMRTYLVETRIFGFLSYAMFSFLFDWDDILWDLRYRTRHFIFSPVYISCKLMLWWLNNDGFYSNAKTIFNYREQWFDSETPPIFLFVPGRDNLVDCGLLIDHFDKYEPKEVQDKLSTVVLEEYSHLDVLWAKDVVQRIGEPVVKFVNGLSTN